MDKVVKAGNFQIFESELKGKSFKEVKEKYSHKREDVLKAAWIQVNPEPEAKEKPKVNPEPEAAEPKTK